MWSSHKRGTLVRSPLLGRLFCFRCLLHCVEQFHLGYNPVSQVRQVLGSEMLENQPNPLFEKRLRASQFGLAEIVKVMICVAAFFAVFTNYGLIVAALVVAMPSVGYFFLSVASRVQDEARSFEFQVAGTLILCVWFIMLLPLAVGFGFLRFLD